MTARYDGLTSTALAQRLGLPRVELLSEVGSTMDAAHELGAGGTSPGTLVLTDWQRSGRGRQGRLWTSVPGRSVTFTLLERPCDAHALRVLSLRVGLALSRALEAHATHGVSLKWPNDLMQGGRGGKFGGVLVETRWRADIAEWVAIGVGVNLGVPAIAGAAAMLVTSDRLTVLAAAIDAVREAVAREGPLTNDELRSFASRDWLAGRRVVAPARGVVAGIDAHGALVIAGPDGPTSHLGGSPVLEEDEHVAGV